MGLPSESPSCVKGRNFKMARYEGAPSIQLSQDRMEGSREECSKSFGSIWSTYQFVPRVHAQVWLDIDNTHDKYVGAIA
jgi:hypothetical protein